MTMGEVKALCDERGLPYKGEFLQGLDIEEFRAGMIKFNIPDIERIDSLNGEGVWGWISPLDKKIYEDNGYSGKITAILSNAPLSYYGILFWGSEVQLQCHGNNRPTLSPEWVKEKILDAPWFSSPASWQEHVSPAEEYDGGEEED